MSISISTNSTKFCSFDLFWDFDIVYTISINIDKIFYYYFVKFNFYQFDIMKILRVFSSNIIFETKILIILLIVTLKLKMFFEIDKITINYIVVNEITNELIIDEKLKTRNKRTWNRFNVLLLLDDELSSKNNDTINRETKFWYVCDCQYFCIISKNRSQILRKTSLSTIQLIEKTNTLTNDDLIFRATKTIKLSTNSKKKK